MRGAIVMGLTALMLAATTSPSLAAETAAERELRLLGRCGAATNLYRSLMPPAKAPLQPTEADLTLWTRIQAATPKLSARANFLAMEVGGERSRALHKEIMDQAGAQLAPPGLPRLTPREALDLYAPVLDACLAKADALPDPR